MATSSQNYTTAVIGAASWLWVGLVGRDVAMVMGKMEDKEVVRCLGVKMSQLQFLGLALLEDCCWCLNSLLLVSVAEVDVVLIDVGRCSIAGIDVDCGKRLRDLRMWMLLLDCDSEETGMKSATLTHHTFPYNNRLLTVDYDILQLMQIKSLLGTKVEWLYYILEAFNSGDLVRYQELCQVHRSALSAQPALLENEKKLLEKINILCLMEIIFSRPSEDRTIPLSIIAERTKLAVEDVEYLLMKSLSVHLIEGIIDQVSGTVHVSWVQPRVLGIPQIKSLRDRLDNWVDKVHTALLSVEAETPDLVAS
ncbi:hypothetical protein U1Q18_041317 [Sarracenia purpurea var. burkii]